MSRAADIKRFTENPAILMDILAKVVNKLMQNRHPDIPKEKLLQYNEISKTIERLNEAGTKIPDELRRLKLDLVRYAEEHSKADESCNRALQALQEIEGRLAHSLTDVRAAIARLSAKTASKGKQTRYVKRTSPTVLGRELKKAIRELGGAAKKADVLQRMRANLDGKFKVQDLERDAQGNLNWEKWVVAEKARLTREGAIKSGSDFGIWELRRK